jgi:Tol biopolymer transport system component
VTRYPTVHWITRAGGDRPSFSRDGSELLYQVGQTLHIIAVRGGNPRVLLAGSDQFVPSRADWSWSPTTIAFGAFSADTAITTIWLIESDGSNLRRLPNIGTLTQSTYPSWYEDLKSIVVVDSGDPDYHALWRLTVDGSADPVRLTPKRNFCAGRPSAAPGSADAPVAFAGTVGPFNQASNQIWIARPPSLRPTQLNPQQGRSPNWSPDGKWILYESNRLTNGNYQLFIAPASPRRVPRLDAPVPVTDPSIFVAHGEWSRQQDRIVFERGNGEALGVIEVPRQFRMT